MYIFSRSKFSFTGCYPLTSWLMGSTIVRRDGDPNSSFANGWNSSRSSKSPFSDVLRPSVWTTVNVAQHLSLNIRKLQVYPCVCVASLYCEFWIQSVFYGICMDLILLCCKFKNGGERFTALISKTNKKHNFWHSPLHSLPSGFQKWHFQNLFTSLKLKKHK